MRILSMALATAVTVSALSIAAPVAASAACSTYYVSSTGSDTNSGCSADAPWKSLDKVNATTFAPGDSISFQAGGVWSGQLAPLGSGTETAPITIGSYGSGARPIVNGNGAAASIYLHNQHDWTVTGLEIKNTATTRAHRAGFLARNDTTGILHGIHIVGNVIDDVDGYWAPSDNAQPSDTSAISFEMTDDNKTANFDDVRIANNTITNVDAGAIYIGTKVGLNRDINTTNVVIENNTIRNAGGNSIVCVFCKSPLVQYNSTSDSGYRFSGAALWSGWSTNGVWQYNEVARNSRSFVDGQAFDIDNNTVDTVVQYNYSHDNPWGFLLTCCSSDFGAEGTSVVRYNVVQNDGAAYGVFTLQSGLETGATQQVYNNTIFLPEGNDGDVTTGTPNDNTSISYTNNLIYKLGKGGYSTNRTTWSNNLFFGDHPSSEPADPAKITADPMLVNPGGGGDGRASASAYRLITGSPAIGAGKVVTNNGGTDFFGNAVSSTAAPNIGADNSSGTTALARGTGTYLRFNETSGTIALDTSRARNTGVLQSGASRTTGPDGSGAISLTGGSNSWVDLATPAVDTAQSYSVSAWVKANSTSGNQTYVSTDGNVISPFYLQQSGGRFSFVQRASDSTSAAYAQVLGATVATGRWYHLTGVYNASANTIALYVDGVLQGTTAAAGGWTANGHTTVGRAKWNSGSVDFVNGAIDDVRLVARAIDSYEAAAIGTGASAYLPFDETSGIATADRTGNMPTGSIEGATVRTTSGKHGSAVQFGGIKGSIATLPATPIDTSKSFTVSAWVNPASVSGIQTYVSAPSDPISPFYLQSVDGKFAFTLRNSPSTNSTAYTASSSDTASTGTWYHLTGVYDASAGTVSLYVNGSLTASSSAGSMWHGKGVLHVGEGEWNREPADFVNATVDGVTTWAKALTADQVSLNAK